GIGVDDNFFELGGDSLVLMEILATAQRAWGYVARPDEFVREPTIRHLATLFHAPANSSPLVMVRSYGAGLPLFCVPGGYGVGFGFSPILLQPAMDRPAYCYWFAYEGDAVIHDVHSLARALARRIGEAQPSGAIHLLGYSFGGVVAFEAARLLCVSGREVRSLGILDATPIESGEAFPLTEPVPLFRSG